MDDLAPRLLACLQRALAAPDLAWAEPPVALAGGYDTAIHAFRLRGGAPAWRAPLVLRAYRPEARSGLARFEAAVHGCLADLGVPAPRVLLAVEGESELGRPFLVMERAPGRNLVASLQSPAAPRLPRWLGAAQAHLHGADPEALERALAAAGFDPKAYRRESEVADLARASADARLDGLRAALDWLAREAPPAPARAAICHGDFHPLNVLEHRGAVSAVLDWPNVRIADRKSTRLNSSHLGISYAVFCLK